MTMDEKRRAEDAELAQVCSNCRRMLKSVPSLRCWEHSDNVTIEVRRERSGDITSRNPARMLRAVRALRQAK